MPEDEIDRESELEWSMPLGAVAAMAAGAAVMLTAALLLDLDAPGQFLAATAAFVLLVLAGLGARQRPKLAIVRHGGEPAIAATRLRGMRLYRRDAVTRIRIVAYPRLGRRVPMLEIDAVDPDGTERLLIFGRWDLGTDPTVVFDALTVHGLVPEQE